MTASVVLGLCLQALALVIVRTMIRGQWLRHTGALFLLVAAIYHGFTEVVQAVFPGRNPYRQFVSQGEIDNWMIAVSVALLLYSVAYALALGPLPTAEEDPGPAATSQLNLWWLLALAVPLLALALQGAAFSDTTGQTDPEDGYLIGGLVVQFLVTVVAVAGALTIVRFGPKWTLLVLVVEAALLSTVGARTTVVAGCVIVLYGAVLAGVRLPRKQLVAVVAVVALLGMVISSSREVVGREAFFGDQGPQERFDALVLGATALPTERGADAVLDDFVYRLDGNVFGALVLRDLGAHTDPVGAVTVVNSALLAVPSVLFPAKLERSVAERSEKSYYVSHFPSLPQSTDLLAGVYGALVGYGGAIWMLILSGLFGVGMARLDRWLTRSRSPVVFLLAMGIVQSILSYERGITAVFLSLRGVLLLMLALAVARWLTRRRDQHLVRRPEPSWSRSTGSA